MKKILSHIKKSNLVARIISLLVGTFVLTFVYNKFLVANHIVVGGVSGLAILVEEMTGLSTTVFINVSNAVLVVLSFIVLGKKETIEQLIGCITYIMMLNVTAPLAKNFAFEFESQMLMLICVSIVYGLSNGFVYRAGFSTGGTDFLSLMLSEKLKKPMPQVSLVIQIIVILLSIYVFGVPSVMLSVFIIFVSNKVMNAVLFGVSTNKMVYVISNDNDKIEEYIMNNIKVGATEIKIKGGLFNKRRQLLLCVLHNAQYAMFKNAVLSIDPEAFILCKRCYEVNGGVKMNVLPF